MSLAMERRGFLVPLDDTRVHVSESGHGAPMIVLHGGLGMDHAVFGDYLEPLANSVRLLYVDMRGHGRSDPVPEETLNIKRLARDVEILRDALGLSRPVVFGHSLGAVVALQHAADYPGRVSGTIICSGLASQRHLLHVTRSLEDFVPVIMRERLKAALEMERDVETVTEMAALVREQIPFMFADPHDARIAEYVRHTGTTRYNPSIMRHFARGNHGFTGVDTRLKSVTRPVLVLAGRHDRICSVEAANEIALGVEHGELVIFEQSGHMPFVEETGRFLKVILEFLSRHRACPGEQSEKETFQDEG
ncbi:MAG TPA: alpha/beta hydrolase [Candidatus Sumerlaeota bacterium]|nr:alpha/beta hydrolase [Candidatus Sumerlaeota bacterium]